jgi:hypothetical protein
MFGTNCQILCPIIDRFDANIVNDKTKGHKMSHIIDVIRAHSFQSVLHLIGHEFNDKQYSYKLFAFHRKEECNEYILSGFTEDVEHSLPFRKQMK